MILSKLPRKLLCLTAAVCLTTAAIADHHGAAHESSIKMIDSNNFGIDQSEIQSIREQMQAAVDGGFEITINDTLIRIVTKWQIGENLIYAEVNSRHVCFQLDRVGIKYRLSHRGAQVDALVLTPRAAELSAHM